MAWTDYYVDLADGGAGVGSAADPFASLEEACADLETAWGGTTAPSPTRIFVRGNGSLGGAQALDLIGTTAYPILWIGCTGTGATWTRIGNSATATKPTVTCSTYAVTISGAHQSFECLVFTGSAAARQVNITGNNVTLTRCRCICSGTNAASYAADFAGLYGKAIASYFEAATSTVNSACALSGNYGVVIGCVFKGGAAVSGLYMIGTGTIAFGNIIYGGGTGTEGIRSTATTTTTIAFNTIYAADGDGIQMTSGQTVVYGNLIHGGASSVTDYPIRFDGTATQAPLIAFNAWYNVANNTIAGLIETQNPHAGADSDFGNQVWNYGLLAGDPLPNAAAIGNVNDFDVATAYRHLAFPGTLEAGNGYAYAGGMTHGALQLVPDFPAVGNVTEDDTVNGATGTFAVPTEAQVESGVGFGAGGTEFEGTLAAGGGGTFMPRPIQVGL